MFTRKQYMNREVNHQTYYSQFAARLVPLVLERFGEERLRNSTDPYFNDIPLSAWEFATFSIDPQTLLELATSEGIRPLSVSLCSKVCALKSAARLWLTWDALAVPVAKALQRGSGNE